VSPEKSLANMKKWEKQGLVKWDGTHVKGSVGIMDVGRELERMRSEERSELGSSDRERDEDDEEQESRRDDDDDEEMPGLENQDGPKLNRGEKKCRKALMKLGMKPFSGITRVTLRRRDGGIFVINDPEVLRSPEGEGNSYICFGKIEVDSPEKRMFDDRLKEMKEKEKLQGNAQPAEPQPKAAAEANPDDKEEKTGFDRYVGVKGSKLSGGQKQRLAIARVIVRHPQAYLFDEATSALDSKSEDVVQHALENICKGKTTINIAHRLSSIQHCDPIYVISNKKIAEQGTFEELLEKKGIFWKLSNDV